MANTTDPQLQHFSIRSFIASLPALTAAANLQLDNTRAGGRAQIHSQMKGFTPHLGIDQSEHIEAYLLLRQ
jgi:hypothetical protein